MKFYHSTKENVWKEIQKEGILWGCPSLWSNTKDKKKLRLSGTKDLINRYTYLSPDLEWCHFGDVLLEVEYTPEGVRNRDKNNNVIDNFGWKEEHTKDSYCWQFSVFKPISLSNVKRIDLDDTKSIFDRGKMYENLNTVNSKILKKYQITYENKKKQIYK